MMEYEESEYAAAQQQGPNEMDDDEEAEDDIDAEDASSSDDPQDSRSRGLSMDEDDDDDDGDAENDAVGAQSDDDEDDDEDPRDRDDEEVLAAVVVDDEDADGDEEDDEEEGAGEPTTAVVAQAAVVKPTKPPPGLKSQTMASPVAGQAVTPSKKKRAHPSTTTASNTDNSKSKKRQPSTTPKGKKRSRTDAGSQVPKISSDRIKAATEARSELKSAVPNLPAKLSESFVLRNFGQLYLEPATQEPLFSSANAIYPVGFSCDRYEFSPVHGRVVKLRCSILDGKKIRRQQLATGRTPTVAEGPVFRVMWGRGVDEDSDNIRYPYNMFTASTPITADLGVDTVAVPVGQEPDSEGLAMPAEGMRVKVRFEHNTFYTGTISDVSSVEMDKKKNRKVKIVIEYDDGHEETAVYPDPDVTLLTPGMEDHTDGKSNVHLTELNGAPVKCVIGRSALECWGRLLVELGLIDEIILDSSLNAVDAARKEGLAEAKGKMEALKLQRQQARAKKSTSLVADGGTGEPGNNSKTKEGNEFLNGTMDEKEAQSRETGLRRRVDSLRKELAALQEKDRKASIALADARIREIGPFLSNPFNDTDQSRAQQLSWLTTAVRKEKVKMGSTGNKKKIVNATDLLERNNTFFNADIEALIEGLPGSENVTSYIFRAMRTGGATAISRAWVHEAQLRQEREREKQKKLSNEAKAKASQVKERELKRKRRDEVRDARKRQKLEEEDLKKKARAEERLSRLSVQVDERLNKEAAFQREKVIGLMVKSLSREFTRRRKAAELVSGQAVYASKALDPASRPTLPALPPLGKIYDEEILRVWDFITSFGSSFLERGYVSSLPTLDALQEAIDYLRKPESAEGLERSQVLGSLTDLAVALCKPLAPSLTRHLFASLIALNPVLQKDFGAAFFNEVNAAPGTKPETEGGATPAILPVNSLTWQEIARLAFLADALGDLGLTKQESAHILRGYRSAGHPNSKEARRLRRSEDFYISLHRQRLSQGGLIQAPGSHKGINHVSIEVPSEPSCYPGEWAFYLHNVKSLPIGSVAAMKDNLSKAVDLMRSSQDGQKRKDEVERILGTLSNVSLTDELSSADLSICRKVRTAVASLLDETANLTASTNGESCKNGNESDGGKRIQNVHDAPHLRRYRIGLLETLQLSEAEYKELARLREEYMTEALRLKEEMERKEKKEDEEEDEDDDDDEEEEKQTSPSGKNSPAPSESTGKRRGGNKTRTVEKGTEGKETVDIQQKSDEVVAMVVENGSAAVSPPVSDSGRIGKPTEYDDFCADMPESPELIRRCLAVLRTLSGTNAAEPFIYPVDPQTNPGYYDVLVRPMCLREVGVQLQQAANKFSSKADHEQQISETELELVVTEFGRNVRLIGKNALSYGNAGPTVISAAGEMLRIFERLLLEWVLAPEPYLTPLDQLDDERCVEQHPSDDESMVLLCDGCEGKYNMSRLDPPLHEVPNGDWYCPRCLNGRWWGDMDPRIGKIVFRNTGTTEAQTRSKGVVERGMFSYPQGGKPSLVYEIRFEGNTTETWTLERLDQELAASGEVAPAVKCLEAIAESPGYGLGIDRGLRTEIVPIALNPNTSDAAAQVALGSAAFRDTVAAAGTLLLVNPEDMTAEEWSRLLVLLIMKCSSSAVMQSLATKMETEANDKMSAASSSVEKISDITDVFPDFANDEDSSDNTEKSDKSDSTDRPDPPPPTPNGEETVAAQNTEPATVVVEATAVEVVEAKDVGAVTAVAENAIADEAATMEAERKSKRSAVQIEKEKRQRAREDSISAFCIKNQVRSAVASFEGDNVSQVVDAILSAKDEGLGLPSIRCRGDVCAFCGLSDSALGTPLVRVPDAREWKELIPHACRSRRTTLVAEFPERSSIEGRSSTGARKLVTLKVRFDDEIISVKDDDDYFENIVDGGMLEFLPRNKDGFQSELLFRSDCNLPFVTGSLSAHECCAIAVHNTRKVQIVGEHKERRADLAEREYGLTCGRTLEIGKDCIGRSYWRFNADPSALFIDPVESSSEGDSATQGRWHRFGDAASISSVIVSLGKDPITRELRRTFPEADQMIKKKTWPNELLKKKFPFISKLVSMSSSADDIAENGIATPTSELPDKMIEEQEDEEPYEIGEDILVESKSGKILWDATVLGFVKSQEKGRANLYRVHFKGWSSRFDDWVESSRVVEPNDNNRHVQEELLEDRAMCRDFIPPALENMAAKNFLRANDRARGSLPLPNLMRLLTLEPGSASDDVALSTMKAAILMIEAALPIGAIDNSPKGLWNPEFAAQWRLMVQQARGPESLIRCVILLEDAIVEEWMNPQVAHLRSCLPSRWKAVGEASPSSLAVRVFLFDQGIAYSVVEKRKQR